MLITRTSCSRMGSWIRCNLQTNVRKCLRSLWKWYTNFHQYTCSSYEVIRCHVKQVFCPVIYWNFFVKLVKQRLKCTKFWKSYSAACVPHATSFLWYGKLQDGCESRTLGWKIFKIRRFAEKFASLATLLMQQVSHQKSLSCSTVNVVCMSVRSSENLPS